MSEVTGTTDTERLDWLLGAVTGESLENRMRAFARVLNATELRGRDALDAAMKECP